MKLFIDNYIDGFSVENINCWDLSIAAASGYFDSEFYYYYCFLYVIIKKTSISDGEISEKILDILGITLNTCSIDSEIHLQELVALRMKEKNPTLLLLGYKTIYFNSLYKKDTEKSHLLLITGIDKEKSLFNIKDYLIARDLIKSIVPKRVDVFGDFKLKISEVTEMWRESCKQDLNKVMWLTYNKTSKIQSYCELIKYYLNSKKICREVYESYNTELIDNYDVVRRFLYNEIKMFLQIVKRAFSNGRCIWLTDNKAKFELTLSELEQQRDILVNKAIKILMKNGTIENNIIDHLVDNDCEIFNVIQEMYFQVKFIEKKYNLAINSSIEVDSQVGNACAERAVNGKIENDMDCWLSNYQTQYHWMIVNLGKKRNVSTFIIRHHPTKKILVTSDYRLEGSNDQVSWDLLEEVTNNREHVNVICKDSVEYQYFRLYIKKSNSINENSARIFSFEMYD